ncbi:OmpA family protein [Ursidibacter arcticus]|uniref:OmpA family protein n=1 Tax=Ursidibacter arcticus TaxID=1524965 RepID=UPI0012F970F6|nr:OmpA family protein [Ursidibacter arcticus]KAE9534732.1 hypothetical protein A1D25_06085 [Ursidibacter arcticus]
MRKLLLSASVITMLTGCVAGTTISLPSDTYFATDSATIKPSAQDSIREAAGRIHRNILTINHIIVEGNTDNVGNASYNVQLSKRRAQAVANELLGYGVPGRMISVRGNGEAKPIASNSTQLGRAQNRRVDIIVQGSMLLP